MNEHAFDLTKRALLSPTYLLGRQITRTHCSKIFRENILKRELTTIIHIFACNLGATQTISSTEWPQTISKSDFQKSHFEKHQSLKMIKGRKDF